MSHAPQLKRWLERRQWRFVPIVAPAARHSVAPHEPPYRALLFAEARRAVSLRIRKTEVQP